MYFCVLKYDCNSIYNTNVILNIIRMYFRVLKYECNSIYNTNVFL